MAKQNKSNPTGSITTPDVKLVGRMAKSAPLKPVIQPTPKKTATKATATKQRPEYAKSLINDIVNQKSTLDTTVKGNLLAGFKEAVTSPIQSIKKLVQQKPSPKPEIKSDFGSSKKLTPNERLELSFGLNPGETQKYADERSKEIGPRWFALENIVGSMLPTQGSNIGQAVSKVSKAVKSAGKAQEAVKEVAKVTKTAKTATKAAPALQNVKNVVGSIDDEIKAVKVGQEAKAVKQVDKFIGRMSKQAQAVKQKEDFTAIKDILKTKKPGVPAGEKPPAPPAIMDDIKGIIEGKKPRERGLVTHIKESPKTPPELANRVSGEYIPRSTDQLSIKAKNLIKDDIDAAHSLVSTKTDEKAVATAMELINHYNDLAGKAKTVAEKNAFFDKSAEVAHEIAPKLTELGRGVQAATIYARQSPEGIARFAAGQIDKYNKTAKVKLPKITGEQLSDFVEKAKAIKKMPEGRDKAKAVYKLMDDVNSITPSTRYQKAIAVWKAGLLTGMKTTGANVLSNVGHGAMEIAKDAPASVVDRLSSLFTGKRTKAFTVKGIGSGLKEGAGKGLDYLKTGFDERNVAAKLDFKKVNFTSKAGKVIQKYEESIFRLLGAEDQPFYYAAKSRSLYDQAIAAAKTAKLKGAEYKQFVENFVNNPSNEALETAVKEAEMAVFQNETVLGKAAKAVQKAPGGEVVIPFGRTPAAVATQLINYSPVGIAKTIIENIGKGKFNQRAFSQGIGRGLTGIGILAIGKKLYEKGIMTLSAPTSEKERNQWELEGKKPNAILINGKWRNLSSVSPAGNILLVGGYFQKGLKETGDATKAMSSAMAGTGKSLVDQTFLKGLSGAMNALNDPSRYGQTFVENTAGSLIPTISSDIAQATDPKQRQANSVTEAIKARIPGLRKSLLPKQDTLGQDIKRNEGPAGTMADPFRSSPAKTDPVTDRLRKLLNAGENTTPAKIPKSLKVSGKQKILTPQERYDLQKYVGEKTNEAFAALFENEDFSILPEDEQSQILSNIHSDIVSQAKREFLGDKKINEIRPVYDQVQELIRQGKQDEADEITGAMSEEDFKLYKEIRTSEKTADTKSRTISVLPQFIHIQKLLKQGKKDEADQITEAMPEKDYEVYVNLKKKLNIK